MRTPVRKKFFFLILLSVIFLIFNLLGVGVVRSSFQDTSLHLLSEQDITISEFNRYNPDGNISVLVVVDTHLLGEEELFIDYSDVKSTFEHWLIPFETRFDINFHICNVTSYTPGDDDSLDISIEKVASDLSWTFSTGINDPSVNGNNQDFLIIFQERYNTGQNRANAIYGNALIISHNQIWTSDQLILLHEVGHLFGGTHYSEGEIPNEWYGSANKTIMSYDDLYYLKFNGWNKSFLPMDDYNFERINSSRYRFDQNDADLDSLPNFYEYRYGMNPCLDDTLLDTDNDGLNDLGEYLSGTHPLQIDTDKDTYSDWAEDYLDTSPLNSSDFPILSEPIVFNWSIDQTITKEQQLVVLWRGIATDKDKYSIYQNDTLLITSQWIQELISYETSELKTGLWMFKCIVNDTNGNSAVATTTITILEEKQVGVEGVITLLALAIIIYFKRKSRI